MACRLKEIEGESMIPEIRASVGMNKPGTAQVGAISKAQN